MDQRSTSFQQVLDALLDNSRPFPPKYLHHFSDINENDLSDLAKTWSKILPERRANLLEDLEEVSENDTLVYFDDLARFALKDEDGRVRAAAIRLLWQSDDPRLVPQLLQMLEKDPETIVRASAAAALGQFVYLGELEELPAETLRRIEDSLLDVIHRREPTLVQRRALESLGYSGRKEVPRLIREAYSSKDKEWLASALFAMGRSADSSWGKAVIACLKHPQVDVQLEAVRAAGQLELVGARQMLIDMVTQREVDDNIWAAAVWSLSQIGGENVSRTIERLLEESEDDDEISFLEDALDNLQFTEGLTSFSLLEVEAQDEEDLDHFIDLDAEDDEEDD